MVKLEEEKKEAPPASEPTVQADLPKAEPVVVDLAAALKKKRAENAKAKKSGKGKKGPSSSKPAASEAPKAAQVAKKAEPEQPV